MISRYHGIHDTLPGICTGITEKATNYDEYMIN